MKKILFAICSLVAVSATAQNAYIGKNDPAATALLKKVTSKYKNYKTLTANISLVAENGQGQTMSSQNGTLFIKGNKYYVGFNDNVSFSDGGNIYNYDKTAKEIQITRINPNDNIITPQKLFTDFYEKDYLYKLNDEVRKGGNTIEQIELTPTDKTQAYFKILLDIDKATKSILGAKIFEKNGNKYIYTVSNQKYNSPISDTKFNFNAKDYPGVEVVDLR